MSGYQAPPAVGDMRRNMLARLLGTDDPIQQLPAGPQRPGPYAERADPRFTPGIAPRFDLESRLLGRPVTTPQAEQRAYHMANLLAGFAGSATPGRLTVVPQGGGRFNAMIDGQPAGHATVIRPANGQYGEFGGFLDSVEIAPQFRGQGYAGHLYNAVEQQVGQRLVPSPLGLSEQAAAHWRRRLANLPPAERAALLSRSADLGREWGISEQSIGNRINMLREGGQ